MIFGCRPALQGHTLWPDGAIAIACGFYFSLDMLAGSAIEAWNKGREKR